MEPAGVVAQVVVGLPVPRVFSYRVPAELDGRLAVGQRVRVPFRGRARTAVVVEVGTGEGQGLEAIDSALDPVPILTPELLALARWAAEETCSAWGEAVARALPPAARVTAPGALPDPGSAAPASAVVVATGPTRGDTLEAAAVTARGDGRGVLVLAPEIEAARAWAARLEQRLGEPARLVTSGESPRRRWEAFWAARRGAAGLVVGTRTAAFVPLREPGLLAVVDEEDPAHKAPDAPRWHARELALERHRREGGACVLTTAAPSLESWTRLEAGAAQRDAPEPGPVGVHLVDLRARPVTTSLSRELTAAVRQALAAAQSVLLVLNRLGYGRVLACAECGAVRRCPTCRLALTYHREARALTCRLCGTRSPARSLCGRCRGRRLAAVGAGTETLEAEARQAFREATVVRYDGTLAPDRARAAREAFRSGAARIMVGTVMALAALADRPVGLAALVLADTLLGLPDFRAGERTFQLAWRLREGVAPAGQLWIQSLYPEHHALAAVVAGTPATFYRREWSERQELGYPPARRMARIVLEGPAASGLADELAGRCREAGLAVLGPAAPGGRAWQLAALGGADLPRILTAVLASSRGRRRARGLRLTVDVDPVELA
jgi:primosomal protein N' (replication factor Y)